MMEANIDVEDYFSLGLVAIGHFEIQGGDVIDAMRNDFMNANAPAIMFPYVRAFVSSFTSQLGPSIPTIIVPTQFFKGQLPIESFEE